jgi:glutamate-1-semialdehyde aminotransferase
MLCGGILPQAAGYDEQWTVSVQHTDEDIENTPLKVEEVL